MAPSSRALYEDDRTWLWKFILRVLTIFLAAGGIVCVAWAFSTSSGGFEDPYYYNFYGTAWVPWALGSVSALSSHILQTKPDHIEAHGHWR